MSLPDKIKQAKVIVIGASAGGVEALRSILPDFSRPPPFALVAVLHLPSHEKSLLPTIFSSLLKIPASEPEDKESIQPAQLYFASPNYHLLLERDGTFSFSLDAPVHFSRPSIDMLFESAAEVYREKVAGIVLSGANHDGAGGLTAILEAGGTAIVQSPDTAQSREMPEAALRTNPSAHALLLPENRALLQGD